MTRGNGKKVLLAMSGGVDSSVAAALLLRQGYQVLGCFMRLGSENEPEALEPQPCSVPRSTIKNQKSKMGCCSVNDAADARMVAAMLDIPFYVLNFKKDFGRVIDYFVDEYNAGRTPNPCIRCNDWLKFGRLHHYAHSLDCDFVATGHHARIHADQLLRALDPHKDQSYVLFGTPRDQLAHMLLPIGELHKADVRHLAAELNLPVHDKPDSQEICFVHDNDYAALLRRRAPGSLAEGDIVDREGNVLGRHGGQQQFTIGQRRGVGVAMGYPIYVVDKDPQKNTITLGPRQDLMSDGCSADQTNWLIDPPPTDWTACTVKVRYNCQPAPAQVRVTGDDSLEVRFDQPISAVTAGQAVVCYDGDRVLGGGWIHQAHRTPEGGSLQ
ncbi:MAG: tRNA 2-thiouridine(34) synthase MnmA [Phycisphaeraceae bacterium]|nr:tRNA 2-thiouridine(34) synthase MnmA [Phycisphaeraceae bacterium]